MAWIMQDSKPFNTDFISPEGKPFVGDAPLYFFRIDENINNGLPYTPLMIEQSLLGAFANATKLKRVSIPRSVKYIGANAFTNTQLRSVTIASDCTYFDTSFPEGCVVNFYPD